MKQIYIVLLLLCIGTTAMADVTVGKASLRGRVTDASSGEPVVGVSIYFPLLKQGTVSDADGYYHIERLPMVKTTIQVSYVAHLTIIENIDLHNVAECNFVLQENNAQLKEVVVTGLTGSARADRSPSPVSVVSPQSLRETSATNIIDAMTHQPGISQITTGSGISKPVIRGMSYNRIVTVNDGIRQEGQQWGDEHGIEIDAQSVHSIEILKGPASLMYGSDALGGVVVMHPDPVRPQGTMGLDVAGEYKNKADGRVPGSHFHERAVTGMVGINRNWGYSHLKLSYYHIKPGLVEGERDEDTGALEPSPAFQKIDHYKAVLDQSFILGDGSLKTLVGYQQNRRREFEDVDEPGLDFRLHTINYDMHYLQATGDEWQYAAGVSGMWQRSENLGTEFLIPAYRLFDIGAFASVTRQFSRGAVSGSGMGRSVGIKLLVPVDL